MARKTTPARQAPKKVPAKKVAPKKVPAKKVAAKPAAKKVTSTKQEIAASMNRVQRLRRKPATTSFADKPIVVNGFNPSPQQTKVFDWVRNDRGNAFIEAVAGSGKTTTLIQALKLMPGSVAFTAYNKKIAVEISQKTEKIGKQNLRVGTFHSFGFNAWRRVHRGVRVDDRNKRDMMLTFCEVPERFHSIVHRLVSLGKQSCVYRLWDHRDESAWLDIIEHHDMDADLENPQDVERVIKHASNCAEWSRNNCMHVIDFDDMIWLPVITEVSMDQYQWVLVDEAQDTNPARRLLAAKMLAPGGRAMFVGDRHQAIYGFTGADNDAVDIIIKDFRCKQLPLTITYRCPKAVVTEAKKFVSHIIGHESAPQGIVRDISAKEFIEKDMPGLDHNDAILCRKTKPLIELAFNLIRRNIACHVEGRDIGQGLIKLARRWQIKTIEKLRERLEAYRDRELQKLKEKKREASADALNDRVETLFVLMDGCRTIDEVVIKINEMFQDTDGNQKKTVTLSTVHKSKGREWDRVYILGWREYMPSKWASAEWQKDQEKNLQYVAVTRSKGELVFLEAMEAKLEAPDPAAPAK